MTDKQNMEHVLQALADLGQEYEKYAKEHEQECDEYWKALPYDDKLMAFYSVCKRIHQGDIRDQGTYRWVLYDVFGFDMDSYGIGMECGYMAIHNAIADGNEYQKLLDENKELKRQLATHEDDLK